MCVCVCVCQRAKITRFFSKGEFTKSVLEELTCTYFFSRVKKNERLHFHDFPRELARPSTMEEDALFKGVHIAQTSTYDLRTVKIYKQTKNRQNVYLSLSLSRCFSLSGPFLSVSSLSLSSLALLQGD